MIVPITARLHAAMMAAAAKIATKTVARWGICNGFFLTNPKPKPLTQGELIELFLKSEARAMANSKNQKPISCGCCAAENTKK